MSEERKRFGFGTVILCLVGVIALYFLSDGPVLLFTNNNPQEPFVTLYAPLDWIYDNCIALRRPMEWYVGLWVEIPPLPPVVEVPKPSN